MNNGILYLKFSVKALLHQPSITTLKGIVKYFSSWRKHLSKEKNSVADAQPWMAFGAIDFLKKRITKSMKVFEYGSGGSTLFWSNLAAKVVSIEHHEGWYAQMKKVLEQRGVNNVDYRFIPGKPTTTSRQLSFNDPDSYVSGDESNAGLSFKDYVLAIEEFHAETIDVVIIDGRARPSCIKHAVSKVAKGGYLVVDNSERDYYLRNFKFPDSEWNKWIFNGPVPYNHHFSQTTILQKKQ